MTAIGRQRPSDEGRYTIREGGMRLADKRSYAPLLKLLWIPRRSVDRYFSR